MNQTVTNADVHFSGRVQGVGFRYMTYQVATGFEVRGYVKNLADGRVRLEAEGDESEVRAFLRELEKQLDDYIRETEIRWGKRPPEFTDFVIAR